MGYDDIYDDTLPGGDAPHYPGEGEDDGLVDTMVIMGLALSLAFFVYYRQQRERAEQARRQRELLEQQQQQQGGNVGGAPPPAAAQNNGGLFPPPGDPNFNQWVVGGVGH